MSTYVIPSPDDLQRRIDACEAELKALRKLQRLADAAQQAEEARRRREEAARRNGGRHHAN
jgi:hypothetical protein